MSNPSHPSPHSPRRARPRLTQQIQVIRELWLLREQARVQAAERCFLAELERLLTGRVSFSDEPPPRPPIHPHHVHNSSSAVPPPPPPPVPGSPHSLYSGASFLDDGHVYESHPPPRLASDPVRERRGAVEEEVEQLRSRQRVTNLSPEFRALLEGNGPQIDYRTLVRSRSFGELSGQRTVSSVLESEFRHQLEGMLVRREQRPHVLSTRSSYNSRSQAADAGMASEYTHEGSTGYEGASTEALESVIRALREEVQILKNVISASFDLQLDIQRSIRQEVSAAMNAPAKLSLSKAPVQDTSACTVEESGVGSSEMVQKKETEPIRAGICTICLEARIDSLLYSCGHMCTCSLCGRHLIASGQCCPICRAPVRDVVRAFMVTQ